MLVRTITVLSTPRHTAGATGFVPRAKDGGKDVKLFVSGGPSLKANDLPLIRAYLASRGTTYALLNSEKVDTASNPHVYYPQQQVAGSAAVVVSAAVARGVVIRIDGWPRNRRNA